MAYSQYSWAKRNAIDTFVADLRAMYSKRQLRDMFTSKNHDNIFTEIGRLSVDKDVPDHIFAWTGYGLAVGNKYETEQLTDEE